MRTKDENDLSVAKALSALNDLADRLELPEYVREEASAIYRRVSDRRLTMGRSKVALVAVCVYAAIRRAKLPLMLRDVLPVMDMGMAEFNLYMNVIKREARIEVPPPAPAAWIPKIASECHFSPSTQLLAANYLHLMVKEGETFGMLPHVVAAIALCRMGALNGERKNVYQVARAVKCAPASILKGFVSDSAALRNCGRSRFSESESRRLDGRIAGGDIPRSCSERIGGYYSRMSYVSNIDSRVRT
jgi:transcription initiation factor TFIIB